MGIWNGVGGRNIEQRHLFLCMHNNRNCDAAKSITCSVFRYNQSRNHKQENLRNLSDGRYNISRNHVQSMTKPQIKSSSEATSPAG